MRKPAVGCHFEEISGRQGKRLFRLLKRKHLSLALRQTFKIAAVQVWKLRVTAPAIVRLKPPKVKRTAERIWDQKP
jgi:hypothetical protein